MEGSPLRVMELGSICWLVPRWDISGARPLGELDLGDVTEGGRGPLKNSSWGRRGLCAFASRQNVHKVIFVGIVS